MSRRQDETAIPAHSDELLVLRELRDELKRKA